MNIDTLRKKLEEIEAEAEKKNEKGCNDYYVSSYDAYFEAKRSLLKELIKEAEERNSLYDRVWIRCFLDQESDVTIENISGSQRFCYEELLDIETGDKCFADVCEKFLRDSEINKPIFISREEGDNGNAYILLRIK